MEGQFHLANITKSATKYHHILSLLPEEIAAELLLTDPMYEDLKSSILEGLKTNRHQLIEQALAAAELGCKRPTQLVNEIKKRFCDIGLTPDETIIKSRPCHRIFVQLWSAMTASLWMLIQRLLIAWWQLLLRQLISQ